MKLLMEKMYYISYGKKIDRVIIMILDIVPVFFLQTEVVKKLEKIFVNGSLDMTKIAEYSALLYFSPIIRLTHVCVTIIHRRFDNNG